MKKLLPGIRMQLTLLSLLLIVALIVILTLWLSQKQNQALQQELTSQTEVILETFKNIMLEQSQLEKSLTQMETMREKIRQVNAKNKNYYEQYFSEKHLLTAEKEIRAQLRTKEGLALSEKEAAAIINARKKILTTKVYRREEINWNPIRWFSEGMLKEVKQIERSFKTQRARDIQKEKEAIRHTVYSESREKLGLFNFDTSRFRIQAFDSEGQLLFDTAMLEKSNLSPINQLHLNQKEQREILENFTQPLQKAKQKATQTLKQLLELEALTIDNSLKYANSFHTIHRDEDSSSRAKILLASYLSHDKQTQKWLTQYREAEEKLLQQLRQIINQLRNRLDQLKIEKPKNSPNQDSVFRELYQQYQTLLQEKKKLAQTIIPTKNSFALELIENERQQNLTRENIETLKKKIAKLKEADNSEKKDITSEKEKLALLQKLNQEKENLALLQEKAKILKYRAENWNYAKEEFLRDSFEHLADAVLYNQILLRYRHDSLSLRDYLRSPVERRKQKEIWLAIRKWIMSGKEELTLPTTIVNKEKIVLLKNGILAKTRSEAEEYMWQIDTMNTYELAHKVLYEDSYAGFLRFIADLTDYQATFQRERKQLHFLLLTTGLLGSILAFLLSSVFVKRIRRVCEQAAEVGMQGNLNIRFSEKGWDEITTLQKSLNQMLSSLKASEEVRSQMHAAAEVQKRMLPATLPAKFIGKLDAAMYYRAMSNIGGDYYDFIAATEEYLIICIGDVSNHGIGPALIMSNLSAQIKLLVDLGNKSPAKILAKLNELLLANTPEDMFVTFFLALYDTKNQLLYWSSAGHNDAILIRQDGKSEIIPGGGLPLGMEENALFLTELKTYKTTLQKGDLLFLFTDGLTEAKNSQKQFFGFKRLLVLLQKYHTLTSRAILDNIASQLAQFLGQLKEELTLEDDIAMVAIKF